MPAYVWMWTLFILTLAGDWLAGNVVSVGWFWLLPVFFFALALFLTLDAHARETQ
jgi:hypothetical protein